MIEQSAGTGPPETGTWGKPGKLGKPWGNCKREREQEQVRERERSPPCTRSQCNVNVHIPCLPLVQEEAVHTVATAHDELQLTLILVKPLNTNSSASPN